MRAAYGEDTARNLQRFARNAAAQIQPGDYYEPNFLVVKADDYAQFEVLCRDTAERIADLFEKNYPRLERALNNTGVINRGWAFSDLAQYLYAKTQRGARELLEQRGALPPRQEHQNGAKWIFWAEEPKADADN